MNESKQSRRSEELQEELSIKNAYIKRLEEYIRIVNKDARELEQEASKYISHVEREDCAKRIELEKAAIYTAKLEAEIRRLHQELDKSLAEKTLAPLGNQDTAERSNQGVISKIKRSLQNEGLVDTTKRGFSFVRRRIKKR